MYLVLKKAMTDFPDDPILKIVYYSPVVQWLESMEKVCREVESGRVIPNEMSKFGLYNLERRSVLRGLY